VYKTLTDNIQACLSGNKTPAQAMADAQTETDRILRPISERDQADAPRNPARLFVACFLLCFCWWPSPTGRRSRH